MKKDLFIPLNLQFFGEEPGDNVPDAGVQDDFEPVDDEPIDDNPQDDPVDDEPIDEPVDEPQDDEDGPELPPEQKNAFQKRLEREQKKIREQVEQETEQKYGRHKQIIDMLGGDPDAIEQRINETQWAQEANQYGYDQEESQAYIRQKRMEQELFDLRVDSQINDLADNATYAGIKAMKKDIKAIIRQSGGALNAQQAYWALGGEARAAQAKREAQQREIAKRGQSRRTVQTDGGTISAASKPLPPEIAAQAKKLGLSRQEVEDLMSEDFSNIDQYRKWKQKKRS